MTEQKQVTMQTNKLVQFMIDRNTQEMEKIVDKKFTLTHITGYVQSKAEWFSEIEAESMKYFSAKEEKSEVKIAGTTAEVTVRHLLDARIWGSRNIWRLQQKMQLEKRDGKWIILKSVASTY